MGHTASTSLSDPRLADLNRLARVRLGDVAEVQVRTDIAERRMRRLARWWNGRPDLDLELAERNLCKYVVRHVAARTSDAARVLGAGVDWIRGRRRKAVATPMCFEKFSELDNPLGVRAGFRLAEHRQAAMREALRRAGTVEGAARLLGLEVEG